MPSRRLFSLLLLLLFAGSAAAAQTLVKGVRVWSAPDKTRVVLELSGAVDHRLFSLKNPQRVVLDLPATRLAAKLDASDPSGLLSDIRSAPRRHGRDLRVVLDLGGQARPQSFLLKPTGSYGYRLVIDLDRGNGKAVAPAKTEATLRPQRLRDVVIAIDAGHGGEDPGAHGRHGTKEKNVTLAIARRLERLVSGARGMRAVMTRKGDYYVSLRKRTQIARAHKADLFISIHADANPNRRARGASVYALSQRGASSEAARWLANNENAADLVGGVSLDDKSDTLASVLLDLSQSATIDSSLEMGRDVLGRLGAVGRLHRRRVEQAGFVVLKSPDIPSILVETAFISNPREERELGSAAYQQKIAESIFRGIRAYLKHRAPPGTRLAEAGTRPSAEQHVIRRGETLGYIAARYNVSVGSLRAANDINGDAIRAGQTLTIPHAGGT